MFIRYNELSCKLDIALSAEKDGGYNYFFKERAKLFRAIRNTIRTLADDLGFRIKKQKHEQLDSTWFETFIALKGRWDAAMIELRNLDLKFYNDRIENL